MKRLEVRVGDWVAFIKRDQLVHAEVTEVEPLGSDSPTGDRLVTTEGLTTECEVIEIRKAPN